jgi:hypothetical protein
MVSQKNLNEEKQEMFFFEKFTENYLKTSDYDFIKPEIIQSPNQEIKSFNKEIDNRAGVLLKKEIDSTFILKRFDNLKNEVEVLLPSVLITPNSCNEKIEQYTNLDLVVHEKQIDKSCLSAHLVPLEVNSPVLLESFDCKNLSMHEAIEKYMMKKVKDKITNPPSELSIIKDVSFLFPEEKSKKKTFFQYHQDFRKSALIEKDELNFHEIDNGNLVPSFLPVSDIDIKNKEEKANQLILEMKKKKKIIVKEELIKKKNFIKEKNSELFSEEKIIKEAYSGECNENIQIRRSDIIKKEGKENCLHAEFIACIQKIRYLTHNFYHLKEDGFNNVQFSGITGFFHNF